jgi:hypothetical protein
MRVGLIAEGVSDVAVLRALLKGWLGLQKFQVPALQPDLQEDETDRRARAAAMAPGQFSNWELVLKACRERTLVSDFLIANSEEDPLIVVQIDTDWLDLPNSTVARPKKEEEGYALVVRTVVVNHLVELLGDLSERTRFAVAVEEVEAWLLCLHEPKNADTCKSANPKGKLDHAHKSKVLSPDTEKRYADLSAGFKKRTSIEAVWNRNISLKAFLESLPAPPPID